MLLEEASGEKEIKTHKYMCTCMVLKSTLKGNNTSISVCKAV